KREAQSLGGERAAEFLEEAEQLLRRVEDDRLGADARSAALGMLREKLAVLGQSLGDSLENLHNRHAGLLVSDRKNKFLLALLALFVVGQIMVLEYRWLVKPIVRMSSFLRRGDQA